MLFSSWLRNWKQSAPAARRRAPMPSRRPAHFRLRLEALEDRTVPAIFTAVSVPDLIDDINAVNTAGGSHTIILAPGTTFSLLTANNGGNNTYYGGANGLPVIGGTRAVDLTIVGNGNTIERVGSEYSEYFRLFDVAPGASLTLGNVTLQGGFVGGFGGAILNQGTLTVSDSTLSGNRAAGYYAGGGGIYNAGGTVTVSGSTLSSNTAEGVDGGAISNGGTLTVSNSRLYGNWASTGYSEGGIGGGIYNAKNCTVIVQDFSSIEGNYSYWFGDFYSYDVHNEGVVYKDNTSRIGVLYGNPAIPLDSNTLLMRITDATVTEGNTGSVAATFTVTLSVASTGTVTVTYATGNGTATAGSDYQAASGTLTFAPGETSQSVTVLVNGDRLGEPNETFFVNLSSPTNAIIADGQGVGTILDDEPRISIDDVTKAEGKKGQKTLFTFTVTLSAAYDQAVTVSYRTPSGTAKAGEDYVAKSGTVTFAPGETSKTITVAVKGDSTQEADEYFYLDLFDNSSNSLFTKNRGIGTILNDD